MFAQAHALVQDAHDCDPARALTEVGGEECR